MRERGRQRNTRTSHHGDKQKLSNFAYPYTFTQERSNTFMCFSGHGGAHQQLFNFDLRNLNGKTIITLN